VERRAKETCNAHWQCTRSQLQDDSKLFGHKPLKKLPHSPYYTGISPADFCLFGKVKNALIKQEIPHEIDLLEAVTEILNGISDAEL
jgi:hypothetical protein